MTDATNPSTSVQDHAPYDALKAFSEGVAAHRAGNHCNPYEGDQTAGGQRKARAWERGAGMAVRYPQFLAETGLRGFATATDAWLAFIGDMTTAAPALLRAAAVAMDIGVDPALVARQEAIAEETDAIASAALRAGMARED